MITSMATKNQSLVQPGQRFADPRPDLAEDSALWSLVLEIAHETNPQLAINLYGFRCEGTRLKRSRKWGLIMEPILPDAAAGINSDITGITGWQNRKDYQAMAQEYLQPYHGELVKLLKRVG